MLVRPIGGARTPQNVTEGCIACRRTRAPGPLSSVACPTQVEVRCLTLHPEQPGVVFAGTQAGPYRSTDAGDTWEPMHFPDDEPVVWSLEIHPADARVMYAARSRWRSIAVRMVGGIGGG